MDYTETQRSTTRRLKKRNYNANKVSCIIGIRAAKYKLCLQGTVKDS